MLVFAAQTVLVDENPPTLKIKCRIVWNLKVFIDYYINLSYYQLFKSETKFQTVNKTLLRLMTHCLSVGRQNLIPVDIFVMF